MFSETNIQENDINIYLEKPKKFKELFKKDSLLICLIKWFFAKWYTMLNSPKFTQKLYLQWFPRYTEPKIRFESPTLRAVFTTSTFADKEIYASKNIFTALQMSSKSVRSIVSARALYGRILESQSESQIPVSLKRGRTFSRSLDRGRDRPRER